MNRSTDHREGHIQGPHSIPGNHDETAMTPRWEEQPGAGNQRSSPWSSMANELWRKRSGWGRVGVTFAFLFAAIVAVGTFVPLQAGWEESFEGSEYRFWTGSDEYIRSEVVEGALRFEIVDTSVAHPLRHLILDGPFDGIRFEATVTFESHHYGGLSIGCWSGDRSYLATITGDRFIGIAEFTTVATSGNTDPFDVRPLMEMTRTPFVKPATRPNRLRVDCVADDDGGWFAVHANGETLGSVSIPGDVEGFDAIGFAGSSEFEGGSYVIDDVVVAVERPSPPDVVRDIEEFPETGAGTTWFERNGIRFPYPDDWVYMDLGLRLFNSEGAWRFAVAPPTSSEGSDWISLDVAPGVVPEDWGLSPEQVMDIVVENETSSGGTVIAGPQAITIGDLPGFAVTIDGIVGDRTRHPLAAEAVFLFGATSTYALTVQYSRDREAVMVDAWSEVLASFETPPDS